MLRSDGYKCALCGRAYAEEDEALECAEACFSPSDHVSRCTIYQCGRCGESFCSTLHANIHERACEAALCTERGSCLSCAPCDIDGYRRKPCPLNSGAGNITGCAIWERAYK